MRIVLALSGSRKLGRVLLVDRDSSVRRGWARALLEAHFEVLTAEDVAAARTLIPVGLDLVIAAPADADELFADLSEVPPLIAVMDAGAPASSVEALLDRAFAAVERREHPPLGLALLAGSALASRARGEGFAEESPLAFVTVSPLGRAALRSALRAATAAVPLAIIGETGTGKRALARSVHARSRRRDLVEIDAHGLDAGELARRFDSAKEDETVILSCVEALNADAQAVLRDRLAGGRALPRLISTALPSLREDVASGRFSRELFFRVSPVVVDVPPLATRPDDVVLLAQLFARRAAERFGLPVARFSREAIRALKAWTFSENASELEACVVRAITTSTDDTIRPGDLGLPVPGASPREPELLPYAAERERALRAFERAYAERVLAHAGGNVSQAARLAGMDPANMRRLLRRVRGAK